jgi:hypothetical protein
MNNSTLYFAKERDPDAEVVETISHGDSGQEFYADAADLGSSCGWEAPMSHGGAGSAFNDGLTHSDSAGW